MIKKIYECDRCGNLVENRKDVLFHAKKHFCSEDCLREYKKRSPMHLMLIVKHGHLPSKRYTCNTACYIKPGKWTIHPEKVTCKNCKQKLGG